MTDRHSTYDPTTIALHWLSALMIVTLWFIGRVADFIPRGTLNTNVWSLHVSLGFALVTVLLWRIVWRFTGRRHLPAVYPGPTHVLAVASHVALYVLLAAVVTLGVVNAFVRGFSLFDIAALPQFGDKELRKPITFWHGLAANGLIALALLHSIAALYHHYVLRDAVLTRMLPQRRPFPPIEEGVEQFDS
ncbi:cytochrome b [Methylocella silvestris]|uniref:Cytochrome B n=1 Tax=Methylocella silvestris TaxID=199596 RepID=A0A2J7TFL1_METSI|nr:cytochrome b [Methylocella silvestris]PNG25556.1 cytochrome B [Methylocella silvestris]